MKTGDFSLELINAETRQPIKEFTAPDGKVYIEAEPDLEYFVKCRRERGVHDPYFDNGTSVALEVDGTYLGYDASFLTKSNDLGLWKSQNGVSTNRSLKLILKKRARGAVAGSSSSSSTTPVGRVRAVFYETIYFDDTVQQVDHDKTGCLNQSTDSTPSIPSAVGAKKAFTSVSGSAVVDGVPKKWNDVRRGRGTCLGEMTIYYTSALGLLQLGILAPIDPTGATITHTGGAALTNTVRKRIKTEPKSRVVFPDSSCSHDLIDITGDD